MRHVVMGGAALVLFVTSAYADGLAPPTYTVEQAQRGAAIYKETCAELCHGHELDNGEAPPLSGEAFKTHWGPGGLDAPFALMLEKMPPTNPGGLPPQVYADVLAFILSRNGVPPSDTELPADMAALAKMAAPK